MSIDRTSTEYVLGYTEGSVAGFNAGWKAAKAYADQVRLHAFVPAEPPHDLVADVATFAIESAS